MQVFLASSTQWRRAGMAGIPTGLDYAGVRAAADALDVAWDRDLIGRLRTMEREALAAMAELRGAPDG